MKIGLHKMCEGPLNTVKPGLGSLIRYSATVLKADYIIRKDKSKSADVMDECLTSLRHFHGPFRAS